MASSDEILCAVEDECLYHRRRPSHRVRTEGAILSVTLRRGCSRSSLGSCRCSSCSSSECRTISCKPRPRSCLVSVEAECWQQQNLQREDRRVGVGDYLRMSSARVVNNSTSNSNSNNHNNNNNNNNNNNTIWRGSVVTGEEPPPHSGELKHALPQAGGPNPIPAVQPYVVRTPHLHGAPTTEETVKL